MKKFSGSPDGAGNKFFTLTGSAGGQAGTHVKDKPELVQKAREMGGQMADFLLG